MKIGIIKHLIPGPNASVINTLKLAQGFFELGHEVEILAIEEFKQTKWKFRIKNVHDFFNIDYRIKIKYFKGSLLFYFRRSKFMLPIINFLLLFPKLFDFLDPEIKISKYCKKNNFELVICRDTFRAALNNIINKIPTVIDLHGYKNIWEMKDVLKLKNSKYFKGFMVLNNFIKRKLINVGFLENKIKVMDNAINLKLFDGINEDKLSLRKKLNLPLNKTLILYTGAINIDRGIDVVLNAANILNKEKFSFYFIGSRKKRIKIWKKFIKTNNIQADITFLTVQPFKVIPYYLKAADILLATFSSNCPTLEFMSPVKIFEYMASKRPFIATNIGRNSEICSNNECLFTNVDDPIDLSKKIKKLTKDKDLREKLINNAYKKAKEHTFNERCKIILDLL
ncbi:MAG: glycosyltransferase [Promethearchaeota archaeon]